MAKGRHGGPTVHFEDKAEVAAVPGRVLGRHHVVSRVLQLQVGQQHGAVVAGVHPVAVVLGDVGEAAGPPGANGAAHRPGHEAPSDGGDAGGRHVHREEDIVLHRPDQVPLGGADGDRSGCRRTRGNDSDFIQ